MCCRYRIVHRLPQKQDGLMVDVGSDDDVSVAEDCEDGLCELFLDGIENLAQTVGNTDVSPAGSI